MNKLEEANIESILAEAEKARAHARLMNAQAEKMEQENKARLSTERH